MRIITLALALWLVSTAASADPVTTAITAFFVSAGVAEATAVILARIVLNFAISTALGILARVAAGGRHSQGQNGITTPITMLGDINPQLFVIGTYGTAGQLVYPPLTHGPTAYKTFVIAVCAKKGVTLGRIAIDGAWAAIGTTVHPDYGNQITGKYLNYAWVKFYDGTQTAVDPMMVAKYGAHADFPYTSDMVGAGNAYAIVTFRFNTSLFSGNPKIIFELGGIPLYDPRLDTTAGGTGTQRFGDDTTWTATQNPVVMIYNIMRGITTAGGDVWGGQVAESDVPFASWSTAMDYCDDVVDGSARYTAGFEIKLDDNPSNVIDELLKACAGTMTDVGGQWKINSGSPQMPTLFITDDDVLVSERRTLDPIKKIAALHNSVSVSFVDPASVYKTVDADLYSDPSFLQADGNRRLVAAVQMPAVTSAAQVTRLQVSTLADDRQKGTHSLTFPARMAGIEPLDVISWNSDINSYTAQAFEVQNVLHDVANLTQHVTMRAVDYADWA